MRLVYKAGTVGGERRKLDIRDAPPRAKCQLFLWVGRRLRLDERTERLSEAGSEVGVETVAARDVGGGLVTQTLRWRV